MKNPLPDLRPTTQPNKEILLSLSLITEAYWYEMHNSKTLTCYSGFDKGIEHFGVSAGKSLAEYASKMLAAKRQVIQHSDHNKFWNVQNIHNIHMSANVDADLVGEGNSSNRKSEAFSELVDFLRVSSFKK